MKLSDEQVIKALECCVRATSGNDCEKMNCPACKEFGCYYMDISDRDDSYEALVEGLGKDALDLIKRKDKVNKLSAKEIVDLKIKVEQQKAEIERFENIKATINKFWDILLKFKVVKRKEAPTLEEFAESIQEIQAEAIKEFGNNIIHEIVNRPSKIQSTTAEYLNGSAYRQNEIIDIIQEMVGENNV